MCWRARRLIDPRGLGLSEKRPLPTIKEVDDPVLARIWDTPVRSPQIDRALGSLGHVVEQGGRQWVFVYRELRRFGPEPWLVGQYFPIEDATGDLDRLMNGAIVGGITLAVAALLALVMGLSMARSIRTLTSAAELIEQLKFDEPFHRKSRLREIDDAGHSLDKARGALKWFGAYVPRRLVFGLMELGEDAVASRRRVVTVMFTDIVGFTPQAEELPEQETADMLNHHFALLGSCIENDQGVIDKYIGDCVMAVWGGLSTMEDHADHAVHAALEMGRVVHEDNLQRIAAGQTAGPPARRHPFRSGDRRQHRRAGPGQLHRGRRHGERGAALRAARQGVHARRRGRDRPGERRHDRGDEAPGSAGGTAQAGAAAREGPGRAGAGVSPHVTSASSRALDGKVFAGSVPPSSSWAYFERNEQHMERRKLLALSTAVLALAPFRALHAQDSNKPFTPEQLDQMLAPIALYPDALLAQVLMAATYPLEVVEAARWSQANPNLKGDAAVAAVKDKSWDVSVKSLVAFPQTLQMMSNQLDWTQKLGDAMIAQQKDVATRVQRLRAKAAAAGNLKIDAAAEGDDAVERRRQRDRHRAGQSRS